MRKHPVALTFLGFLIVASLASAVFAVARVNTLEVTGIFEKIDNTQDQEAIVLNVNGKIASGPLGQYCVFTDEKQTELDRDTFVKRYLRRVVTVELIEHTGEVIACRVGS